MHSLLLFLILTLSLSCTDILCKNTVYLYRIYCETEEKNVYTWSETAPTTCPNNTADTINEQSISILEERAPDSIKVQEESVETDGSFRAESNRIEAAGGIGVQTSISFSWPYPVSPLAIYFTTEEEHRGDFVTLEVPSHKIVGRITQDVTPGDTTIYVDNNVSTYALMGYYIELFNGHNNDSLGRVIARNEIAGTLTLESAATHAFSASTPTYVKITHKAVDNLEFGPPMKYSIGSSKIGASYVPANIPVKIIYTNSSESPKKLVFYYELLH